MASITKLPNGKYRVQWRDILNSKKSRHFATRMEARKFAAALSLSPEEKKSQILLSTVIEEYRDTVTVKKRGHRLETLRLNRLA